MTMTPIYPNNETPDEQIDNTIIKLAEQYATCDRKSKEINDERKTIRDNAEKLGIPSKAFQHAVGMVKHMSDGERRDYQVGVNRMLKVIGERQGDLFPQEAEKVKKREERKAEAAAKAGRSAEELNAASDANRRSDPNAGGAQVDLEEAIAEATQREQAEGDAVLAGKSEAWRTGYNAFSAGGELGSNPYTEGSADARDWIAGYNANKDRAFEAARPPEGGEADPDVAPEGSTPIEDPQMSDGETFNQGAGKPKKSQSAKAAAIKAAAGL